MDRMNDAINHTLAMWAGWELMRQFKVKTFRNDGVHHQKCLEANGDTRFLRLTQGTPHAVSLE